VTGKGLKSVQTGKLRPGSLIWLSEDSLGLFIEIDRDGFARFRPLTHPEYWTSDKESLACFTANLFVWDLVWEPER
jgi:hypothetical protein